MKKIKIFNAVKICIIYSIVLSANSYLAQDIHFSQFDNSPLNLNPANTGSMNEDYRFSLNHKTQWNSISIPYATYSFSYDMAILKGANKKSHFGVGLLAFTDKAGTSEFKNSLYAISLSSSISLNLNNKLAIGLQVGSGQKSVKYDQLSWDNQFSNGTFDSNLPSGESSIGQKKDYIDISTGILLYGNKNKVKYEYGASYFHVNNPKINFIESNNDNLSAKITAHGELTIQLPENNTKPKSYLVPKFWYLRQGGHQEIYIGTLYETIIQGAAIYTTYRNEVKFGIGGYYSVGDAFIIATTFDHSHISLGISYDINTSKLSEVSSFRGGIEVSLIYKSLYKSDKFKLIRSNE